MELRQVSEVASGVDALYLSGLGEVKRWALSELSTARREAEADSAPVPFEVGDVLWHVAPGPFGKYRYRLEHPFGIMGVSPGGNLPPVRIEPRAEYLHGVTPEVAAAWFMLVGSEFFGGVDAVAWHVSRLDLFCDVQGWVLAAPDRRRFVGRPDAVTTFEGGSRLTGFTFGKRGAPMYARVYDKTVESGTKGGALWAERWSQSSQYQPGEPVWRTEFEMQRPMVRQFIDGTPEEVLAGIGGIWGYATEKWLSYRAPNGDSNRSRWPVSSEWLTIREASLRGEALGLERVEASVQTHRLRSLPLPLRGYVSSVGALTGAEGLGEALDSCRSLIERACRRDGKDFDDLVHAKRLLWGLK